MNDFTPVSRTSTEPLTYDWLHADMPMQRPDLTDMEVASKVRMLMRNDLDHEGVCILARDRIMALSKRIVELEAIAADQKIMADYVRPLIPDGQNKAQAESVYAWIGMLSTYMKHAERREPASEAEIENARATYADDDLAIDDDAAVSRADGGYWVSAWVWIANDDGED